LIPIPGLFIPISMAGSVAARWIAGLAKQSYFCV
jgi:hypothetical protein